MVRVPGDFTSPKIEILKFCILMVTSGDFTYAEIFSFRISANSLRVYPAALIFPNTGKSIYPLAYTK